MTKGRFLLVTTVKDEGPRILEWVAWHRLCGFDWIMIFQNGSTDLTQRSLRVMQQHGIIDYIPNERGRGSPQIRAYARASAAMEFTEAEWCLAIDGDEFFVSRVGSGTVAELTDKIGAADAMLINWRNFGSSGHRDMSDQLTAERFTRTVSATDVARQLTGFKTLFRTSAYSRIGIHNARYPLKEKIRVVNGSGLEEDSFNRLNWRCTDPGRMALAQISHFAIRDASSFVLKTMRGRGHQSNFQAWESYWRRFESNLVEDRSLADRAGDIRAEMERMDQLSEGRLMLIRRKSQSIWERKLAEARKDPEACALLERIVAMIDEPAT